MFAITPFSVYGDRPYIKLSREHYFINLRLLVGEPGFDFEPKAIGAQSTPAGCELK